MQTVNKYGGVEYDATVCTRCERSFRDHLGAAGVDCIGEFPMYNDAALQRTIYAPIPWPLPAGMPQWKRKLGILAFIALELLWVLRHPVLGFRNFTDAARKRLASDLYEAMQQSFSLAHAGMVRDALLEMSAGRFYAVLLFLTLVNLPFRVLTALGLGALADRFLKWFNHDEE